MQSYILKSHIVGKIEKNMMEKYFQDWFSGINRNTSVRGNGSDKLRTYCTFKAEFFVEECCKKLLYVNLVAMLHQYA